MFGDIKENIEKIFDAKVKQITVYYDEKDNTKLESVAVDFYITKKDKEKQDG